MMGDDVQDEKIKTLESNYQKLESKLDEVMKSMQKGFDNIRKDLQTYLRTNESLRRRQDTLDNYSQENRRRLENVKTRVEKLETNTKYLPILQGLVFGFVMMVLSSFAVAVIGLVIYTQAL